MSGTTETIPDAQRRWMDIYSLRPVRIVVDTTDEITLADQGSIIVYNCAAPCSVGFQDEVIIDGFSVKWASIGVGNPVFDDPKLVFRSGGTTPATAMGAGSSGHILVAASEFLNDIGTFNIFISGDVA